MRPSFVFGPGFLGLHFRRQFLAEFFIFVPANPPLRRFLRQATFGQWATSTIAAFIDPTASLHPAAVVWLVMLVFQGLAHRAGVMILLLIVDKRSLVQAFVLWVDRQLSPLIPGNRLRDILANRAVLRELLPRWHQRFHLLLLQALKVRSIVKGGV